MVEQVFFLIWMVWMMCNSATQCRLDGGKEEKGNRKIFMFKHFLSCHKIWILLHTSYPEIFPLCQLLRIFPLGFMTLFLSVIFYHLSQGPYFNSCSFSGSKLMPNHSLGQLKIVPVINVVTTIFFLYCLHNNFSFQSSLTVSHFLWPWLYIHMWTFLFLHQFIEFCTFFKLDIFPIKPSVSRKVPKRNRWHTWNWIIWGVFI